MITHSDKAAAFIADDARTNWHDQTLWMIRGKRDKAARYIPEWELLRNTASSIKEHTLNNLGTYLDSFEKKALANGIHVHWAYNGKEHNSIVYSILKKNGISSVVKSKSMLTEECHLNDYLFQKGIEVTDTDLGERIVQLRKEAPSHIVLPAIHLRKEDVSDTFCQHLHTEKGNVDPVYLTRQARKHLRKFFYGCEAAITGVNFAVAGTGSIVVCTNEGNADLGVHTAKIHIASMGIEKIIPEANDLGVFLRLLARSATGQSITTYSSHFNGPAPGKEMHVIIVNNKRTEQLANPDFKNALKCIRCAACFNTCPVYRRSGGHSYHTAVAGPIGSILAPNLDKKANADLPFASTLCGSCTNVCPVKIDIHVQLWKWRQVLMKEGYGSISKKISMKGMGWVLGHPVAYRLAGAATRWLMRYLPFVVNNKWWNKWYRQRNMPAPPDQSFSTWYKKNHSA